MAALSKTQRRKRRLGIVGDVYAILIYTVLYIPVAVMIREYHRLPMRASFSSSLPYHSVVKPFQ